MCQDCTTASDRAKAAGRELLADLLLPFFIYGLVLLPLVVTGTIALT